MPYIYFQYVTPASVIVPLTIGFCRYKSLQIGYRFLIAVLCFSLLSSIAAKLAAYFFHNNILVREIYTLSEFPLLAGFYYHQFHSGKMRRAILWMISAFTLLCVCLIVVFAHVVRFDDYSTSVEALLIMSLGVMLINDRNQLALNYNKWGDDPINWFNTGIMLYFSGSFFIFLCFNYFLFTLSISMIMWDIHATFFLLMNVFFTVGFIKVKDKVLAPVQN